MPRSRSRCCGRLARRTLRGAGATRCCRVAFRMPADGVPASGRAWRAAPGVGARGVFGVSFAPAVFGPCRAAPSVTFRLCRVVPSAALPAPRRVVFLQVGRGGMSVFGDFAPRHLPAKTHHYPCSIIGFSSGANSTKTDIPLGASRRFRRRAAWACISAAARTGRSRLFFGSTCKTQGGSRCAMPALCATDAAGPTR